MSSSNEFHVLVGQGGRWSIEVRPLSKTTNIDYLTFDGMDTYCVRYTDSIIGITNHRPAVIATEAFTNHYNNAYISSGGYPFDSFDTQSRVQALWLAFGAGSYLRDHPQESMPLPWSFPRWNLLAYGFRIEYELNKNEPYSVRALKFIRSTGLDLSSERAELDRSELVNGGESMQSKQAEQLEKRKALWPNGFIAGDFRISDKTNYQGVELPLAFSLEVYDPRLKNNDRLSRKFLGVVTNITEVESSNLFRPPIISLLSIMDERPRFNGLKKKIDGVHYELAPTQAWYPQDANLIQKLFDAEYHTHLSDKRQFFSKHAKRFLIIAAIVMLSLVPPIIYSYKSRIRDRFRPESEPRGSQ